MEYATQIQIAAQDLARVTDMTPAEYAESVGADISGTLYGVKLAAMEIYSKSLLHWLKQAGLYVAEEAAQ